MQVLKCGERNTKTKICIKENHTKIINCKINDLIKLQVRKNGREGDARGKRYGNICITDSLCYKAETNTPLWSNYTPIKTLKKNNTEL